MDGGSDLRVAVMMLGNNSHCCPRVQTRLCCFPDEAYKRRILYDRPLFARVCTPLPPQHDISPAKKQSIGIAPRTEALRSRRASMRHWGGQGRGTATNQSISGPPRSGAKSKNWGPLSCPRGYSESISHLDHFALPTPTGHDHIYIQLVTPRPERPARTQICPFRPLQHHQR